jgi:hypothetical protein
MADDVSITFSAQIGQLISGVDQVKSAIQSISEPVNAIAGVFTSFGEAFAGAFAIDQVAEFIAQMEDLGTSTLRTAAMLGTTTKDTQELGFIAKATGGSAESLATAMERFQLAVAAAQDPTSRQARALAVFGLTAKELISLPLPEQMNKFADAVSKFADGTTKTAALEAINRVFVQLLPVLDQGRAGLDRLREAAENAGAIVSQSTVVALDQAGTASMTLKASITALGESIVAAFAPAIVQASADMTAFVGNLSALIQTSNIGAAAMDVLGTAVHTAAANFANIGLVINDLLTVHWIKAGQDWLAGNEEIRRIQKDSDDQLIAQALLARGQLQNIMAADNAPSAKPQAPALAVPNKDAINASMAEAQEQMKLADEVYQQQVESLNSQLKLHQITESAKTAATLSALEDRHGAELAALAGEEMIGGLSKEQYARIQSEKTQADQKYAANHQKIIDQAMQEEQKQWNSLFSEIEGAFNSQLRGLLAGTTSWSTAMKNIAGDLVIKFIEAGEKIVAEWLAGEIAKTTATVTGVAARTAAEQTGASTTILAQVGNAIGVITADAAKTFAGVFAFLAPVMGPAASGPAAASAAAVEASAVAVPGAAIGGTVLQTGLATVHQGEDIVPASISQPYGGAGGGAGGGNQSVNFNGIMIGTQAFFNQFARQIAQSQQSYASLNPSVA